MRFLNSGSSGSGLPITTDTVVANDDIVASWGDDSDVAFVFRSTSLTANTALTGVFVGTPVVDTIPASTMIISNTTDDGDIVFATATGGNSREILRLDGSGVTAIFSGNIIMDDGNGAAVFNSASSATVPTLIPNKASITTGWGGTTALISGIVAGVQKIRVGANVFLLTDIDMGNSDVTEVRNLMIGNASSVGTSGQGVATFKTAVAPSSDVADQFQIWSADISGAGTAGTVMRSEDGVKYEFGTHFDLEGYGSVGGRAAPDADIILIVDKSVTAPTARALDVRGDFFVNSGTSDITGSKFQTVGITINNSGNTHTNVSTVTFADPRINITAGTVTNASTVYIESAPTEGTNNYALFSDSGLNRFDGNGSHIFEFPSDGTVGVGAITGRIALSIAGTTRYFRHYPD